MAAGKARGAGGCLPQAPYPSQRCSTSTGRTRTLGELEKPRRRPNPGALSSSQSAAVVALFPLWASYRPFFWADRAHAVDIESAALKEARQGARPRSKQPEDEESDRVCSQPGVEQRFTVVYDFEWIEQGEEHYVHYSTDDKRRPQNPDQPLHALPPVYAATSALSGYPSQALLRSALGSRDFLANMVTVP
jgi:hypothetical protein